jgi:hypothetical protein
VAVMVRLEARSWELFQKRTVQKGDLVMVMSETMTRWQRLNSSPCGRPCARLHQLARCGLAAQGPCPLTAAHLIVAAQHSRVLLS